jgi:hypothetical protein
MSMKHKTECGPAYSILHRHTENVHVTCLTATVVQKRRGGSRRA